MKRAVHVRRVVAHLLTAVALTAGVAIGALPPLQAAPAPAHATPPPVPAAPALGQWPAPQAPLDETPIGPTESAGASRDA